MLRPDLLKVNHLIKNIGRFTIAFSNLGKMSHQLIFQVCHLLFNVFGILLFYPIPFMRRLPLAGAKMLGNTTAKYRSV